MNPQLITKFSRLNPRWSTALLGLLLVIQLFIPLLSAASSVKSEGGQQVVLCTLQGLQTVLLAEEGATESQDHSSYQGSMNCPLCSLTHLYISALTTLSLNTLKAPSQQKVPLPENIVAVIDPLLYTTSARSPPIV